MPTTIGKSVLQQKDTSRGVASLSASSKFRLVEIVFTAAFWALFLFVVINLVLWKFNPFDRAASKDLWSGTGSIDLAVQDFRALKQRPKVVLLGSSLVMFPFWAMDKEKNPRLPDIFHYHRSLLLEQQLSAAGVEKPVVFNLAIFGQMASDAFIYVDQFLKGSKAPDVVVLGIAPRDFSDADLPAPMATLSFKRLVGLPNLSRYGSFYLPSWNDKADFIAAHCCFFYGNRWHLQREVDKGIDKLYGFLGIHKDASHLASTQAGFMLSGSNDERWNNSLEEYRRRYHNIENRDLTIQMSFMARLLDLCAARNIKVVIVNMPLTDVNRQLFPSGFYDHFRGQIAAMCNRPRVKFLDLGESKDFVHEDFWDTTHLDHLGGHKLINHLLPVLIDLCKRSGG